MYPAAVKKMLPPALVWLLEMLMFPLEFSSMSVPALKVNADLAVAASSLIEEVEIVGDVGDADDKVFNNLKLLKLLLSWVVDIVGS